MKNFKIITRWLLFIVSGLFILSGYGITEYQTVSKITFGLLGKAESFRLHSFLVWPFIILLLAHVAMASNFFRRK